MRDRIVTACCVLLIAPAGCKGPSRMPWDNLKETQQQNTELSLQVQSLQKENQQLKQQVETLAQLDKQARMDALCTLTDIKLHKRTGLYDKDADGTAETLVVYLQTLDAQQDQVKTPGRCTIELWNLTAAAAQSKIAQWTLEPADLQTLWGGNIFAQYYRIELPLENAPPAGKELTVRAVFTDLLSGRTLTDQLVVLPQSN